VAASSLIELVFVVGLAATTSAAAVPSLLASADDMRAAAAARYLSSRLQQVRMEAALRGRAAALRVSRSGSVYTLAVYVDGNRDGIRARDIQDGIDWQLQAPERLQDRFSGVDFGALPGLPPVDPSSVPPGNDPIRLGSSDMVSFSPTGTCTTGSLYIRGKSDAQYVVRVFGETGKVRTLKFNPRSGEWKSL
jgi:type II secretory pathway pseudopilin PulG